MYEQAAKKAELAKKHFTWLARTHVMDAMEENEEEGFEELRCVPCTRIDSLRSV